MLRHEQTRTHSFHGSFMGDNDDGWSSEEDRRRRGGSGKGKSSLRDTEDRILPASERAPPPHGHS